MFTLRKDDTNVSVESSTTNQKQSQSNDRNMKLSDQRSGREESTVFSDIDGDYTAKLFLSKGKAKNMDK